MVSHPYTAVDIALNDETPVRMSNISETKHQVTAEDFLKGQNTFTIYGQDKYDINKTYPPQTLNLYVAFVDIISPVNGTEFTQDTLKIA